MLFKELIFNNVRSKDIGMYLKNKSLLLHSNERKNDYGILQRVVKSNLTK